MTESEAIEACKKKATSRHTRLGPDISAFLNDESIASKVPQSKLPIGHWSVIFRDSWFDTEQYFTVNNATGQVTWENEPPARWLAWLACIIAYPFWLFVMALSFVIEPLYRVWKNFRLPRCPYCRGKLRTSSAEQCFICGKAWHRKPDLGS